MTSRRIRRPRRRWSRRGLATAAQGWLARARARSWSWFRSGSWFPSGSWFHRFADHLWWTVVLASAFAYLEVHHLVGLPDSLALRLVEIFHAEGLISREPARSRAGESRRGDDAPVVLRITNELYERYFDQQSPLNRTRVKTLLEAIMATNPRQVVIDLDLSPAHYSGQDDDLDCFLDRHQDRLVLVTPMPTQTLRKAKHDWMSARCRSHVRFGLPDIVQSLGAVLRYDVSTPTLANVAAERDWQPPADHRHDEAYESPCQQVRDRGLGPDGIRFLSPLAPPIESETRPINYRAFLDALDPSEQGALRTVESLGTIAGRLAGRTVFLGGTYGATDKYLTPIGVLDGVMIHAAASLSRRHPIREAIQYAYLFEIVVGVLLCYFFHFLWDRYHRHREDCHKDGTFGSWSRAVRALAQNLAVLSVLVFAAVGLSVGLLSFRTWLSPVPLITALFLKTAIAHGAPGDEAHGVPPAPTWNVVLLFLRVAMVIVLVPVMLRYLGRHP